MPGRGITRPTMERMRNAGWGHPVTALRGSAPKPASRIEATKAETLRGLVHESLPGCPRIRETIVAETALASLNEDVPQPLIIFVDTNCFLQMCDFNQADWKALFDSAKEIDIHVCEAVIKELDVHKVSQSERRRKRARAALKTIEAASQAVDGLILKDANPKLRMHVSLERIDWEALDLPPSDEADEMLVAVARQTSSEAIVLSYDTGPRLKARKIGLVAHEPPEEWLLKPEPSEESRRLSKIEKEVQSLKSQAPDLRLAVQGLDEGVVALEATRLEALGPETITALRTFVTNSSPMKHVRATMSGRWAMSGLGHITDHDVYQYESDYSNYRVQVEEYFRRLHERAFIATHVRTLEIMISNMGSVSARNLSVSIEVSEPIRLMSCREDAEELGVDLSLPEPPDPPRGDMLDYIGHMPDLASTINRPKNPTRFRWASEPDRVGDTYGSKICEDFRPKREAELGFLLLVFELSVQGRVTVEVSAEDQESLSEEFIVRFVEGKSNWSAPHIREALPEDVRLAFESLGDDYDFAS